MYFAHWFAEMCNKHETTPTAVAIAVGVSPTSASYWLNGRNMPKKTTILKLEKYFGEKYEKEKSPASEDTELDSDSIKILELLHQLTPENSVRAIAYIQGLVDTQ